MFFLKLSINFYIHYFQDLQENASLVEYNIYWDFIKNSRSKQVKEISDNLIQINLTTVEEASFTLSNLSLLCVSTREWVLCTPFTIWNHLFCQPYKCVILQELYMRWRGKWKVQAFDSSTSKWCVQHLFACQNGQHVSWICEMVLVF